MSSFEFSGLVNVSSSYQTIFFIRNSYKRDNSWNSYAQRDQSESCGENARDGSPTGQ